LRIEMQFKDDVAILRLSGKFLAGSDGPYLRQKVKDLIDAGTKKLIINFADVPYIDSTGLGFLAGSRVTSQNAGVRLIIADMNVHIRRILDDLNLSQFFVLASDEAAALELMSKPPSPKEFPPTPAMPEGNQT
jgi:anti-sigma B factor antagonist